MLSVSMKAALCGFFTPFQKKISKRLFFVDKPYSLMVYKNHETGIKSRQGEEMKPERKDFWVIGVNWLGLRKRMLKIRTAIDVQIWGDRIARALGGKWLEVTR